MSELVLTPLKTASKDQNKAGSVTTSQPVFWYTLTFKDGKIDKTTGGDNKDADLANINYVRNALGMSKQEYAYEMTETVTKSNNDKTDKKKVDYITTKKNELISYNNELAHTVLTLLHRTMWREWKTPDDKGAAQEGECYLSTVDINEAFQMITSAVSGLRDALNDILEMKYPSAISTKMVSDSIAMRKLQIKQTTGTELEKLNKKVAKKPKK